MALEGNSSASKDSETTRLLQVWDLPIPEDPCMVYSPTLGEKWQHSRGNCRSIFHTWILWVSKGWWWENGVPQVNFLNLALILVWNYPRQKKHFRWFILLAIYKRGFPCHSIKKKRAVWGNAQPMSTFKDFFQAGGNRIKDWMQESEQSGEVVRILQKKT